MSADIVARLTERHPRLFSRTAPSPLPALGEIDDVLAAEGLQVGGIDEAGAGPLAGPIVAGGVVLPADHDLDGLDDSKKITPASRERLYEEILACAVVTAAHQVDARAIDAVGIRPANIRVMSTVAYDLAPNADVLLVDWHLLPHSTLPTIPLAKGDRRSVAIAAASIVAKVVRDRIMDQLDELYPGYGFATHKGYGTAAHREAIRRLGPSPVHRRSFNLGLP